MPKYHGRNGAVLLAVNNAGSASSVANLSAWSLSIEQALAETTSLGDTFSSFVAGIKNATGSLDGFFADNADIPFDAFDSAEAVSCYLYPAGVGVAQYWYGQVFPSNMSVEDSVSGAVTFKTDIQFSGGCTRVG